MINKRLSLQIKSNLNEMYAWAKANPGEIKGISPQRLICGYIDQLVGLQKSRLINDENCFYPAQDLAEYLFPKMNVTQGIDLYLDMFKSIISVKGAGKYRKELLRFKKLFSYWQRLHESRQMIELQADSNLVDIAEKDKKVFEYLMKKYSQIAL